MVPACQNLGQRVVTDSEQTVEEIEEVDSSLPVAANDQRKEILLNLDEQSAIEYIINQRVVTESQLRNVCHISNPVRVMNHLIEKMEQCNFPWISTEESQNGELIYMWSAPE